MPKATVEETKTVKVTEEETKKVVVEEKQTDETNETKVEDKETDAVVEETTAETADEKKDDETKESVCAQFSKFFKLIRFSQANKVEEADAEQDVAANTPAGAVEDTETAAAEASGETKSSPDKKRKDSPCKDDVVEKKAKVDEE